MYNLQQFCISLKEIITTFATTSAFEMFSANQFCNVTCMQDFSTKFTTCTCDL